METMNLLLVSYSLDYSFQTFHLLVFCKFIYRYHRIFYITILHLQVAGKIHLLVHDHLSSIGIIEPFLPSGSGTILF